jgi:sigma-B regulation protein RsbU (phosphoserine phosphatase)
LEHFKFLKGDLAAVCREHRMEDVIQTMPYRILVVDDEPDLEDLIRQRFRKRIRADELTFLFAANGEEALARIEADSNLDVVLTDINMPVMDGLALLAKLQEAHPLLRSVIVSAYGDMANIRTALNRGAFDFVTKPIDFQDLEITLDKAIADALMRKQAASDRDRLLGIHRELELARSIQESLIPRNFPRDPRFEIYGSMTPATQVGGDLFDFFLLDPAIAWLGFVAVDCPSSTRISATFAPVTCSPSFSACRRSSTLRCSDRSYFATSIAACADNSPARSAS